MLFIFSVPLSELLASKHPLFNQSMSFFKQLLLFQFQRLKEGYLELKKTESSHE